MYRKHYNAIAAALRSGKASQKCISTICYALKNDNGSKFDLEKFALKALYGDTQEQRSKRFITHLRRMDRRNEQARSKSAITE